MLFFLLASLVACQVTANQTSVDGQRCYHFGQKKNGSCRILSRCPSALQEIEERQSLPQICGLGETAPYVCCPYEVGSRSVDKCLEYSKMANDQCSMRLGTNYKISEFAVGREFPHMAVLGYKDQDIDRRYYQCAGALISERFVLTAARCLNTSFFEQPTCIHFGDLNLSNYDDDSDPVDVKVKATYKHPAYDEGKSYNDIGLIELVKDITFSPYMRPICLHTKHAIETKYDIVVTGYGRNGRRGLLTNSLRRLPVQLQTNKKCRSSFADDKDRLPKKIPDASMFCVAPKPALCVAESGSPLQIKNEETDCMYNLIGISTFAKACTASNSSDLFTRVSHYVAWIESIVWP